MKIIHTVRPLFALALLTVILSVGRPPGRIDPDVGVCKSVLCLDAGGSD